MSKNADDVLPFTGINDPGINSDLDWFGNNSLHHCFAGNDVAIGSVKTVLESYPEYASTSNQFGRIPLHYALDRIKVNCSGVKTLIKSFPEGVHYKDNDGITPYDVSVKWKHPKWVKKLLLDADPSMDPEAYFLLKYGILAKVYNWLFKQNQDANRSGKRNRVYTNMESVEGQPAAHTRIQKFSSDNLPSHSDLTLISPETTPSRIVDVQRSGLSEAQSSSSSSALLGEVSKQSSKNEGFMPSHQNSAATGAMTGRNSFTPTVSADGSGTAVAAIN
jgi:hypothetical protein